MNWQGKKVLVTGAGGFIGSHLSESLIESGAAVRAFVHYNALGSWGWLDSSSFRSDMEVVAGDIQDRDNVKRSVDGVDVVFHLAALIAIPYSYQAPLSYLRTNVEGTLNVMQAARELDVECVVHTSTSEVYGTALYVPIDEKHPLQGQSPYSASKIAADKIAESFYCSFGVPVVTVRPFNTFGPRQSARAVIPTIVTQCLAGQDVRLGSLTPTRDLNFVIDTVNGFMGAAVVPEAIGQTINLGTNQEISVGDLAQIIINMIDPSLSIISDAQRLRPEKSEVNRLWADTTLARNLLNWEPKVSLEEGLIQTISWLEKYLERYHPGDYVI